MLRNLYFYMVHSNLCSGTCSCVSHPVRASADFVFTCEVCFFLFHYRQLNNVLHGCCDGSRDVWSSGHITQRCRQQLVMMFLSLLCCAPAQYSYHLKKPANSSAYCLPWSLCHHNTIRTMHLSWLILTWDLSFQVLFKDLFCTQFDESSAIVVTAFLF